MCIGHTNPNLMPLLMKCSLLFGYLNCDGTLDKDGIFTIYSTLESDQYGERLAELRKIIPHTHTVDNVMRR